MKNKKHILSLALGSVLSVSSLSAMADNSIEFGDDITDKFTILSTSPSVFNTEYLSFGLSKVDNEAYVIRHNYKGQARIDSTGTIVERFNISPPELRGKAEVKVGYTAINDSLRGNYLMTEDDIGVAYVNVFSISNLGFVDDELMEKFNDKFNTFHLYQSSSNLDDGSVEKITPLSSSFEKDAYTETLKSSSLYQIKKNDGKVLYIAALSIINNSNSNGALSNPIVTPALDITDLGLSEPRYLDEPEAEPKLSASYSSGQHNFTIDFPLSQSDTSSGFKCNLSYEDDLHDFSDWKCYRYF